jgi:hypothetical protein
MHGAPFLVAHRAGNRLDDLRRAESLGIPLVEADVRRFAGRLEVRHEKTVGPVPILWDRWKLAPPWAPRLLLDELLDAAARDTELMLDLKGGDPRLAADVGRALERRRGHAPVSVCSQSWALLEPFRGRDGVRTIHSVGSTKALRALHGRFAGERLEGVSIHRKLLDAGVVAALHERAPLVISWPVATPDEARELAGWGVDGLITERYETLAVA